LHQFGASFDLYTDARKHKIKTVQLQSHKFDATATLPSEEETLSLHKHLTAQICNSACLHCCIIHIKNVTFDRDIDISDFLANFTTLTL
jgi:hypothetical protein